MYLSDYNCIYVVIMNLQNHTIKTFWENIPYYIIHPPLFNILSYPLLQVLITANIIIAALLLRCDC